MMKNVFTIVLVLAMASVGYATTKVAYDFNTLQDPGGAEWFSDISGNGHEGRLSTNFGAYWDHRAANPFGEDTAINKSVSCNTNWRFVIPDNMTNILAAGSDFTVEAWISSHSANTPVHYAFNLGFGDLLSGAPGSGAEYEQSVRLGLLANPYENNTSSSSVRFEGTSGDYQIDEVDLDLGGGSDPHRYYFYPHNWTHVAATYDGTDLKLYANGGLIGIQTVGESMKALSHLWILRDTNNNTNFYGVIDDFRISDVALDASQLGYHAPIPEPVTMGILLVGGIATVLRRRRR